MHSKHVGIHANIFKLEAICGMFNRNCFSTSQNLKAAVTEGLARWKSKLGLKEQCVVSARLAFRSSSEQQVLSSLAFQARQIV